MVSKRACQQCGVPIRGWEAGKPGPIPRYCGGVCRAAAARARGYKKPSPTPQPPRQLTCIICGREFEQSGRGRNRHTCGAADCARAAEHARRNLAAPSHDKARRTADGQHRTKPPKPPRLLTCTTCGREFEQSGQGRNRRTCGADDCVKSWACRRSEAARARGYKHPPRPPKPPRRLTCIICGCQFEQSGIGRNRSTCRSADCATQYQQARSRRDGQQRDRDKANASRRKHEPRPCRDCGKRLRIGQRCRACSQSLRRNIGGPYRQAAARARVLQRDQWTCRLCEQPIDELLAFPHPRSASIDHVLPLSVAFDRFGEDFDDTEDNWQAAHFGCNQAKGGRMAS